MAPFEVTIKYVVEADDDGEARQAAEDYFADNEVRYVMAGASIVRLDEPEEVDPNRHLGMFTPEGNQAVYDLLVNVERALIPKIIGERKYILAETDAYNLVSLEQMKVAVRVDPVNMGEVHDTEPETAICLALDTTWKNLYGHQCERNF